MSAAKDTTGTWAVEAGTTLSAVQWTPEFSMPNRPSTGPAARSRTLLTEMLAAARAVDASKKDEAQKEESEEIADGEAYLHTAEYHRWYYSQHPRDPRAKLPLGNPTGVDKAQLTEAAKAGAVKKDSAGKPPSPTSPKKEDAEGGEQASSSTTTKDEAATRVAAATVAAFEAAPVVPMPQQVVVPVVQSAAEAAAKAQSPPPPANLANGGVADQKDLSPLLRQYHEQFGTTPAPPVTQALPPAPQLQPGQQSASNIAAVSPGLTQQQQQLQQAQMQLQAQMQGQPLPTAGGAMAPMQDPMSGGMQGGLMGAGQLQNPQQWDISAITGSVVEFACDQEGSRLVQRLAEVPFNLNTIYAEVEPHLGDLVNHPFGNYCVQKLLELGTPAQKLAVVRVMRTRAQELAVDTYGCRVLQRVLDCCTEIPTADEQGNPIDLQQQQITRVMVDEVVGLVQELDGVVPQLVLDQNGNHVVQKILERLPPQRYDTSFVVSSFVGRMDLGMHCYGCRVVQKVFECCGDGTKLDGADMTTPPQIVQKAQIALRNLIDGVMDMLDRLVVNQYGNYIVQHLIINSSRTTRTPVIMHLAPQVADLAMQKFSSNVVERMIVHGSDQERDHLVAIMCTCPSGSNPNAPAPLVHMMRDRFANYVIQKVIEMTTPNQKSNIVRAVTPFIDDIRSTTFGQHLLGRLERIGWLPAGSSGLRGFAEGGNGNGGRGGRGGGGRGGRQNGGGDRPRGGRGGFGQQPSVAQQQQFQGGIQGTQQPYPQSVAQQQQQQQQAPQTQSMGGMQQGTAAQQFQMQVQQSQQPQWAQAQTMQQPQVQQVQQVQPMQPALQTATMQAPSMQQGAVQPGSAQSGQVNQAVTMLQSMLQSIGATGMNPADIFNALTVVMQNQQGQARGGQAMNPADAATALQYAMSMAAQQQGQQGGAQQQGGQQPFDASQAMMLAQLIQRGQQQQPQAQQPQQVPTNLMATGAAATGQPPAGPTTQQQLHDFAAMVEQNNQQQQQQQQQQQAPQTQQLQFAQPMGATTMQTAQFQDPNQWNYFQQ